MDCGICFSVVSCPPIDFPSSLSFYFRSGVWPGLYFSLIPKRLCWQQMCGALQLGENETPPIFRDPVVFIQYCLTAVPSVPQVWDSRTLSSPCSCHCATGGYRLEKSQLIQLLMGKMEEKLAHCKKKVTLFIHSSFYSSCLGEAVQC